MKLILFLFLLVFAGCTSQADIEIEIEKANYCEEDSDCTLITNKCPFGCYIPVNVNEEERILELITNYTSSKGEQCVYSCIQIQGVSCLENKCQIIQ